MRKGLLFLLWTAVQANASIQLHFWDYLIYGVRLWQINSGGTRDSNTTLNSYCIVTVKQRCVHLRHTSSTMYISRKPYLGWNPKKNMVGCIQHSTKLIQHKDFFFHNRTFSPSPPHSQPLNLFWVSPKNL